MTSGPYEPSLLKTDALGRVERVVGPDGTLRVRRVACGGGIPGSRFVARRLLGRERRALRALADLPGVPRLLDPWAGRRRGELERSWIEGDPLSRAASLPADFFDRLDDLVRTLHERGVCHNDLHKEQNVVIGRDGWPHLIDFQLASTHSRRSRSFESRAREDLRHVEKLRRRYLRADGGYAAKLAQTAELGALRRSLAARLWRRGGKPLYHIVTRRLVKASDGEERRPNSGPWPVWTPPTGPRE